MKADIVVGLSKVSIRLSKALRPRVSTRKEIIHKFHIQIGCQDWKENEIQYGGKTRKTINAPGCYQGHNGSNHLWFSIGAFQGGGFDRY